jgi:hypothetical protein
MFYDHLACLVGQSWQRTGIFLQVDPASSVVNLNSIGSMTVYVCYITYTMFTYVHQASAWTCTHWCKLHENTISMRFLQLWIPHDTTNLWSPRMTLGEDFHCKSLNMKTSQIKCKYFTIANHWICTCKFTKISRLTYENPHAKTAVFLWKHSFFLSKQAQE